MPLMSHFGRISLTSNLHLEIDNLYSILSATPIPSLFHSKSSIALAPFSGLNHIRVFGSNSLSSRVDLRSEQLRDAFSWHVKLSHTQWLYEVDHNTRFFHCTSNIHLWRNTFLENLLGLPTPVHQPTLCSHVYGHFFCHFFLSSGLTIDSWDGAFRSLSTSLALSLLVPFLCAKIVSSIRLVNGNKAPGLDNLNFNFIKIYWDICEQTILAHFMPFFQHQAS